MCLQQHVSLVSFIGEERNDDDTQRRRNEKFLRLGQGLQGNHQILLLRGRKEAGTE
ncbi:RING finger protein [Sesbania bispinosa]|nr:RING finger protein [Sesbania bispinosa]